MIRNRPMNPAIALLAIVVGFGVTGVILAVLWGVFAVATGRSSLPSLNLAIFWIELFTLPALVIGGVIGLIVAITMRLHDDRMVGWHNRV